MSESTRGKWSEIFASRYGAATATLCLGVALLAFNAFLASTALPTAVRELHGVALITWATTLYLVFAIMGGVGAALLKQRFGSRQALLASAAGFLIGTLIAAHASSMPEVLVGRVLQGLSEGVVAAISYALIPELFPSRLVPRVFGVLAGIWGIAAFGGPVAAGLLTELISWRAAFLINVPFVLLFATLVAFVTPAHRGDLTKLSFPGLRLLAIGGGIMLIALASLAEPTIAAALLLGAAILLAGTVWIDRRSGTRLLPATAFSLNSIVGAGLWVVLLLPIAGASAGVYLVITLQELWGYGPTLAGAVAALMAVGWSLSAMAVSGVRNPATRLNLIRTGPALIVLGIAGTLGALWLGQIGVLAPALVALGIGFGISWGYLSQTLMEAAPADERDRTSALLPTMQSAGNAIGAALAGLAANMAGFAAATTHSEILAAVVPVLTMGVVIAIAAFAAAIRTTGLAARRDQAATGGLVASPS